MEKWILPLSFSLAVLALPVVAAVPDKNPGKHHVIIVTSELSFIKYDGKFYLCDNDTPAEMTELGAHCLEINQPIFNYALKTTGADIMEMNIDTPKGESPPPATKPPVVAPAAQKSVSKAAEPVVKPAPASITAPQAKVEDKTKPKDKPKSQ